MATGSPEFVREVLSTWKQELSIDWPRAFPLLALGPHRDPAKLAKKIAEDVGKLKSCSDAGRRAIQEDRCARAGITIEGVPCFYVDRTRT